MSGKGTLPERGRLEPEGRFFGKTGLLQLDSATLPSHRNPKRERGHMLGQFPRSRFGLQKLPGLAPKWRCPASVLLLDHDALMCSDL